MKITFKEIIHRFIVPHIEYYFNEVYKERENLVIDGVNAFNSIDVFVAGKMINAFSFLVVECQDQEIYAEYKGKLRELIEFASHLEFKTWGSLNCMTGLYRLKKYGVLWEIVGSDTQERLKVKCDWRKFVNLEDLSLMNMPTNYYGVAFGICRYMELLGWEESGYSRKLFDRLMGHIETYSGGLGYMDETNGEGRFDRYSLLTPGELCAMLKATETEIPVRLLELLRKSCDIHLNLANHNGDGFSYGRSIGAYGDTSSMEVLSIAACLDVLNREEKELAYNFNVKIAEKFVSFWIDRDMKSVNLWDKGRRTDGYRNKNRILGENLSLSMQLVSICEHWTQSGFSDKTEAADYSVKLEKLPCYNICTFSQGEYDRRMAIVRDGNQVISLPLINGGSTKYKSTPYLPIPNANRLLESGADTSHPNLIPVLTTGNGVKLMPVSYLKGISAIRNEEEFVIRFYQEEMADLEGEAPKKFYGIKSETTYRFTKGCIEREETFYSEGTAQQLQEMFMEFATFSSEPEVKGNQVVFREGGILDIEVSGLELCNIRNIHGEPEYCTSHGSLQTLVGWRLKDVSIHEAKRIRWVMKYRT